jgi:hypothetical protein
VTVDEEKLERLAERLRTLRRRLRQPADVDAWELDLYSYDETLVVAADLLDVPVPPGARDEMGPEARAALEEALTAAGVELDGG